MISYLLSEVDTLCWRWFDSGDAVSGGGAAGAEEVWMVFVFTPSEGRRSGPSASVYNRYQNNAVKNRVKWMNWSSMHFPDHPHPRQIHTHCHPEWSPLGWNEITLPSYWHAYDLPVGVVKLVTEVVQNELEAAATEHLTEPRDTCVHNHVAADLAMPPWLQSVQVIINHWSHQQNI